MKRVVFLFLLSWVVACAKDPAAAPETSVRPGINERFVDPELEVDDWLQRFEVESREVFHARDAVLMACKVRPGMVVADIGAGTGLYTRMFSNAAGNAGWVYAVEISPVFLHHIQQRAKQEGQANITTVLCPEDSVGLPPESIDFAFVCDTYHHFEYPRSTMASIVRAMKPGATLVVIDFIRIEGHSSDWVMGHVRAGEEVFRKEIEESGLVLREKVAIDGFEQNYFLRFAKPE